MLYKGNLVFLASAVIVQGDGLEAGPDGASIARTTETVQLSMDVSALAQLMFGHLTPSESVRYGRTEAAPDAPLQMWDAMWRIGYAPFCPDMLRAHCYPSFWDISGHYTRRIWSRREVDWIEKHRK